MRLVNQKVIIKWVIKKSIHKDVMGTASFLFEVGISCLILNESLIFLFILDW